MERTVAVNGVTLSVSAAGRAQDPAILLLHGAGQSLVAWEEEFVDRLAAGGRHVVRFDARDAGRSTGFPVGAPPYGLRDLVADAAALIDALGLGQMHLVAMSQGSAVAQLLALDHPERVASLTLTGSTPGGPGHEQPDLPPMTDQILATFTEEGPEPDWADRAAVVEYLVEGERPYAGAWFDEPGLRAMAGRVFDRTPNLAAQLTNPFLIDAGKPWRDRLDRIAVPTLVLHGSQDPLFPLGHGRALAAEIPGARLTVLEGAGHEIFPRPTWETVIPEILNHTAPRA
ncbi:alpha/beta fold hydrolase [Rhizohabitans arisaemae]|uniref:alpha/beta fold hydrolase n=1 Tax=Rhizohabitans arisaemae TaxID=2720610 RepID=UPI0024B1EFA0|nr:alpha/beta hydrolase [Rhizohabitans arisaemae]